VAKEPHKPVAPKLKPVVKKPTAKKPVVKKKLTTAAKKPKPPAKKEPKKPGRKAWVPDYKMIEDWARQGLTDKQIAAMSGICHQNFCEKKGELSELVDSLEKGRAKGVSMASTALWMGIAKGDKDLIKFYLERKGGWKQHTVLEKRTLTDLTDEEIIALLSGGTTAGTD